MFKLTQYTAFLRNAVAALAILGTGTVLVSAQDAAGTSAGPQSSAQALPALDLKMPIVGTYSNLFSSSADENAPALEASLNPGLTGFGEAMQYGGGQRRRYGKTRYRGSNTNADGSPKYIFYGGAGLAQPLGNTFHYLTPSYGLQVGGGRQFNKHFAAPIEFDYDHFGMAAETLQGQEVIYNYIYGSGEADGLDGNSHVWSFSVDPTYTFFNGEDHGGWGSYVVAGVGFYHKVANFTLPEEEEECYYYCETFEENVNVDHYTSNAVGFSGGLGATYKFSHFSNERFYAEARYVFVANSQRQGVTPGTITTAPSDSTDFYPANSNRTTYLPVKVGIRF